MGDSRPRDEGHSSFPATCSDPELGLGIEELHVRNFKVNFDGLDVGVVVDQGSRVEIV